MTKDELDLLLYYIDCRIDEKIEDAFGRDCLIEYRNRHEAEKELRKMVGKSSRAE